jgi:Protein of unknown function (DUF1648)
MRFGKYFFFIVLLLCIFETARLWFLAPAQMASHFNFQGNPDGFMPKLQFFVSQIEVALIVIGLGLVMQLLVLITPARWINLPNREYWLIPENHHALMDNLSSFGFALFGGILLVVQLGFELSTYANLQAPLHFSAQIMLPAIAGFMLYSMLLLFLLTRSFRLPPES